MFDSIIDYITDIDTGTFLKAGATGIKSFMGGNTDPTFSATRSQLAMLNEGLIGTSVNQSFNAKTPNGAPASVDPAALENQWLSRLNKFGNFQADTMVKAR